MTIIDRLLWYPLFFTLLVLFGSAYLIYCAGHSIAAFLDWVWEDA